MISLEMRMFQKPKNFENQLICSQSDIYDLKKLTLPIDTHTIEVGCIDFNYSASGIAHHQN
jgi:hypothetical protein